MAVGYKSVIFAPLLWEGKGIGVIFVGRDFVGPFSDQDIALLPFDIVYVPKQRFHLASFAGDADSCRLAMNGYTDLSHSYEVANAQ